MQITLEHSTGEYKTKEEFLKFSQTCGLQCYSAEGFDELEKKPLKPEFIERTLKSGHHSIYEHMHLTFEMILPKALAMILNNEKQYATSEKSARYTQMEDIEPEGNKKYDKWMDILSPRIEKIYPDMNDTKERTKSIKKLAQENARYMTSVFTPTIMIHTMNLRQLNHIIYSMEEFIEKKSNNQFDNTLKVHMTEFLAQMEPFRIDNLKNQTDRHLSFYGWPVESHFGDVYSTQYIISLAGFAQAQRHRTLHYQVSEPIELNSQERYGFHIPKIIRRTELRKAWLDDLKEISKDDFPQAQLIPITERGIREDYRSKLMLRLCGHAQQEIMERTLAIANIYARTDDKFPQEWLKPKCLQGIKCNEPCIWGGKNALERII